jgi:selenocysteine lyase/cysteine desulfurase
MQDRRDFLKKLGLAAGAITTANILTAAPDQRSSFVPHSDKSALELADDEDFWWQVQQAYTAHPSIINLNNAGLSPAPRTVQDAVERYNKLTNEAPSYFMWRILDQGREPLRQKLADLAGALPEEIAINRNSTEALNTVAYGLPLQKGDEVVGTLQDYPNMVNAWKQRAAREGIVYKQINLVLPTEDDEMIVKAFETAITPKTKLLHITHLINWNGQILPVKKITAMAKKHGIETLVDGAQSFAMQDFKVNELGCDYFGTSLHKFLCAPVGSGMLWIKKEKIKKVWPLLCNDDPQKDDIRKFETIGTRSFPIEQGIGEAINFHNAIGPQRKQQRLHYLKSYWATAAQKIPRVKLHTSLHPAYSGAIAVFSIDGIAAEEIGATLFNNYKIHVVTIDWQNIKGVRVSPHVYTRIKDLDKFVNAIREIASK